MIRDPCRIGFASRLRIPMLLATLAAAAPASRADAPVDLERAIVQASRDVEQAAADLAALRDRIAGARRPLAAEADALRQEVARLRREETHDLSMRAEEVRDLDRLAAETAAREAELDAAHLALSEHRRGIETRMSRAESLRHEDRLASLDRLLAEPARLPDAVRATLDFALAQVRARQAGEPWEGTLPDPAGVLVPGTFMTAGATVWFAAPTDGLAGLVATRTDSPYPALVVPPGPAGLADRIRAVQDGGEALLPLDVTGGLALRAETARTTWVRHLQAGGVVMIPLLVLGLVAAALTLVKAVSLARARVDGDRMAPEVARLARAGRTDEAKALAATAPAPLRLVLEEGVANASARRDLLEELLHERVLAALPALERHLGTLAVLGGVAPLLGLLGTVTGMIHTFRLVTLFGTGDAQILSGGISEALVTTQTGLCIAIPTLLAHAYLVRRVRSRVARLEEAAMAFVLHLESEPEPA